MIGTALPSWLVLLVSGGYLGLLFAIAYFGDRRADLGRSVVSNPYIYSLSIAVYCTAWTFYGSVGLASVSGFSFLPIYVGPTLMFALGTVVFKKIIRISKVNHITSIADFISSRYGKSHVLGGLVSVIAVVAIMPYMSLQLKAIAGSFNVLLHYPNVVGADALVRGHVFGDTAFWVAAILAIFSILFGTRHIDATEHHEGMVAAIAFESLFKLVAFICVGVFVTFVLFDGFGDIFQRVAASPDLRHLLTFEASNADWGPITLLAMLAVICLPRQFQVTVVENVDEKYLTKAIWLFPLYLFLINIFVLPIAFGGLLWFPDAAVDADTFVLALPMTEEQPALALLAFLGGLSAATGMVIVASVALSTMICNDLVMPLLLRFGRFHLTEHRDLVGLLLLIRRTAICFILLGGYLYFYLVGDSYALASIGLVSFVGAAQFAPSIIGGLYWKGASRRGALTGITVGFLTWTYTLLLPSFARSGWLPIEFIESGPWGIEVLKPYALFGFDAFGNISHSIAWCLLLNTLSYIVVSVFDRQSIIERIQASLFVDVFRQAPSDSGLWRGRVQVSELQTMAERFLGAQRASEIFSPYLSSSAGGLQLTSYASSDLVQRVEKRLAGVIGAASARVIVASTVKGEGVGLSEIMEILDETSHVLEYSRQLEQKSKELEKASAELKAANERLTDLDRMKDDFLSTVTHELRTPLTSIRSFSEILHDTPELDVEERQHFLTIIIKESERLTRLINQVLDLTKIERGRMEWQNANVDLCDVIDHAAAALHQLFEEKNVALAIEPPSDGAPIVVGDRDQLIQLVINLLSNAEKFCPSGTGRVDVRIARHDGYLQLCVADNGPGVPHAEQEHIFDKFHQVRGSNTGNPMGSGLGLAICRGIVDHMGGKIWVESEPGEGANFFVNFPLKQA